MCIVCFFSVFSLYFENTEFVISNESQGKHIQRRKNYTCCIFLSINMESFYVENTNCVQGVPKSVPVLNLNGSKNTQQKDKNKVFFES